MNKILSIIIPTYNMERYLERCLNSLLIPSIDVLDILIINDGSTDKSSEIGHLFALKYPDSIRIIDKENGNYGSCINAGLKLIKGKYVKVLDSDDWFDSNNLDDFVKVLAEIEVDLVLSDFERVDENLNILKKTGYNISPGREIQFPYHNRQFIQNMQMHGCCYKSSIFDRIDYFQTEGISFTDQEWIFYPLSQVKTVYYFNKVVYYYLIGRTGQTVSKESYVKNIDQEIVGIENMLKLYNGCITSNQNESELIILKTRLLTRIEYQYMKVLCLYYPAISFDKLIQLEKLISETNRELYNELEESTFPHTKFRYIHFWRKNKNKRILLPIPFKILKLLINLKKRK